MRSDQGFLGTPPKFNSSPLKKGAWKTTFLLGFGNFSGAKLNFGEYLLYKGDENNTQLY